MIATLLAAGAMAAAPPVTENRVPSCYAISKIGVPPPAVQREVFVLIDQTTMLDPSLKNAVREELGRLVVPGSSFVIGSFSAFAQGQFERVVAAGRLETSVPAGDRDNLSVRALEALDRCLGRQAPYGRRIAAAALDRATAGQSDAFQHSDVISSLRDFAPRVASSTGRRKILIVVSDMIENSSLANFYQNRTLRGIDPGKELRSVAAKGFLANFGGAEVYVIGGGLLSGDRDSYRDPVRLKALETFWSTYFARSNARLRGFGKPLLASPIR